MKFRYLGTAAAEGWPAMFCSCDHCQRARSAGGRNIRTRSQAIIDDHLLIDFPADTYHHILQQGLDLVNVHHCLITHDHTDHFHPEDLEMRRKGFAYFEQEIPLCLYGSTPAYDRTMEMVNRYGLDAQNRVLAKRLEPFTAQGIGDYTVTPLKADHPSAVEPFFYLVEDGKSAILYANDTGWFPQESWDHLSSRAVHLDLVSLDCTCILKPCRNNHMDLATCIEVKSRLKELGLADEQTKFVLHHFSHNGGLIYDELVPVALAEGFDVSWDGMVIDIG